MKGILFNNISDSRFLNKTLFKLQDIEFKFLEESNIFNFSIALAKNLESQIMKKANYLYIEELENYYYLSTPTLAHGKTLYDCKLDVLMSNATEIKSLIALVDRNEFIFNSYITDASAKIRDDRNLQVLQFPNGFTNSSIILTVTNGGD